jgi:hypothetical protein
MTIGCGRVVVTPNEPKPYKVVLEHDGGSFSEHPGGTVGEGEEMIKRSSPRPAISELNNLRDSPEVAKLRTAHLAD